MASSRVLNFTDPYEYQTTVRPAEVEVFPTTGGDFRAELTQIVFDRVWTQVGSESLPRIARGHARKERVSFSFSPRRNQVVGSRINGTELSPGTLFVHGASELHNQTSGPSRWAAMSLMPDDLAAMGRAISGRELARPSVAYAVRPSSVLMTLLLDLHSKAARLAKDSPEMLAHPEVAKTLEDALIHTLIRCLTEGSAVEKTPSELSHMRIISKLEEFVAETGDRPIHLGELCAATGVSEGTIRNCCHAFLGIGPKRYLWLRRMHLARWALLRADPKKATITAIATDQGFWELGRFSVGYRSLFGESPSKTLHRRSRDKPEANRPLDLPIVDFA